MTEADETATDETGNRTAPHPTRRTLLTPQPPHGSSFRLCVGFTTLTPPRSIAPARALALVRSGERTRATWGLSWGSWGFFSKKRQFFVRQISIHRGKFSRDFAKSGKPPPSPRAISLVRLRRGQAICRLAKLARLLIRDRAGRQHTVNFTVELRCSLLAEIELCVSSRV